MDQITSSHKLKLHDYFKMAGLSPDDFDPNYNKVWDNYQFGNCCQRGPKGKALPYFYPVGWKGYALKVKGKYDNGNDNWLNKNNNQEEWYVMYHGTKIQFVKGIMEHGLLPGGGQLYANKLCQLTGIEIGIGVSFTNHIEVCEQVYSIPCKIGDEEYLMAFQVRVRPSALRQCSKQSDLSKLIADHKKNNRYYDQNLNDMTLWDNDYFVVNKTEDIRPYRILLKQINKEKIFQSVDNIAQFSEDEDNESKSKPIQLAVKELVQPLHFFQNPQNQTEYDPVKSSAQKYQFDTQCKQLFKKLEKDNKLVNPLNLVINQKIEASNPEVLFYVLSDQMRQVGRIFNKSLIPDETLIYSFHGQFTADSNDSQAYQISLQETPNLTYKAIASDEQVRQEFLNNFRNCLSIDLKLPESQIQIIAIEEGSIRVVFEVLDKDKKTPIKDKDGKPIQSHDFDALMSQFGQKYKVQLKLKSYFKEAALSVADFNEKYNMTWENHKFGDYNNRGPKDKPQPYFFPIGWKGYALNIPKEYGSNTDWLMMNGNKDEWYVMFHGTSFNGVKGIMGEGKREIQSRGGLQKYKNKICLITKDENNNNNPVKIGIGVYFSNHIEVCEKYSKIHEDWKNMPTTIKDRQFIVAFQSRVRPGALRQCPKPSDLSDLIDQYKRNNKPYNKESLEKMDWWNNDYFVVNDPKDIRPYRILLKELGTTTGK